MRKDGKEETSGFYERGKQYGAGSEPGDCPLCSTRTHIMVPGMLVEF